MWLFVEHSSHFFLTFGRVYLWRSSCNFSIILNLGFDWSIPDRSFSPRSPSFWVGQTTHRRTGTTRPELMKCFAEQLRPIKMVQGRVVWCRNLGMSISFLEFVVLSSRQHFSFCWFHKSMKTMRAKGAIFVAGSVGVCQQRRLEDLYVMASGEGGVSGRVALPKIWEERRWKGLDAPKVAGTKPNTFCGKNVKEEKIFDESRSEFTS